MAYRLLDTEPAIISTMGDLLLIIAQWTHHTDTNQFY